MNSPSRTTLALALLTASSLVAHPGGPPIITTDGTVGPGGVQYLSGLVDIPHTVGTVAGANLFHSFGTFGIPGGSEVTFTGPGSIQNIIARVTGGQPSVIAGALRSTVGTADLFLLNKAGWVFTETSAVDVPGAVHISTADYLRLGGDVFRSTPVVGEALTSAAPSAFGFLGAPMGDIDVNGLLLLGPETGDVSLSAGEVNIEEGGVVGLNGLHSGSPARLDIVTAGGPGEFLFPPSSGPATFSGGYGGSVDITEGLILTLGGALTIHSGDIRIGPDGNVLTLGAFEGGLSFLGRTLTVDGGRVLALAGLLDSLLLLGPGKGLGALSIKGPPGFPMVPPAGASIFVQTTGDVVVSNDGLVGTLTLGTQDAGDVTMAVGGDLRVHDGGRIASQTGIDPLRFGAGSAVPTLIAAGATHGVRIGPFSLQMGDSGDLSLAAQGDIVVGEGGQIYTRTGAPFLLRGRRLLSTGLTVAGAHGLSPAPPPPFILPGNAGDILLDGDRVHILGEVFSEAFLFGGEVGDITIRQRGLGSAGGTLVVQQRSGVPTLGDGSLDPDFDYGTLLTADEAGLRVRRSPGRVSVTNDDESSD